MDVSKPITGQALTFAVTGDGIMIDPDTGILTFPSDSLHAGMRVTVATTDDTGSETGRLVLNLATEEAEMPVEPPLALGMPDTAVFEQDDPGASISAQAGFAGEDLVYALESAPAGATIDRVSGLVRIPTAAPIARTGVIVRATNAAGSATQTFPVIVRANRTVFDAEPHLTDLGFLNVNAAPTSWTRRGDFARLVTDGVERNHGDWVHARGDGIYRCLVRWDHPDTGLDWLRPFSFTGRVGQSGPDLSGIRVEFYQRTGARPSRELEIRQYDGNGTGSTTLAVLGTAGWQWRTWYWVEVEFDGTSVRTRFYPEKAPVPAWQLSATVTHRAPGAFGPGAFPRHGRSMTLDIRRIEYHPLVRMRPKPLPAPVDSEWNLDQIKVQA